MQHLKLNEKQHCATVSTVSYLQWCMSHKPNMKSVGSKSVRVAVMSATATQWQCVHGGRLVGLVGNVCSACVYVW